MNQETDLMTGANEFIDAALEAVQDDKTLSTILLGTSMESERGQVFIALVATQAIQRLKTKNNENN